MADTAPADTCACGRGSCEVLMRRCHKRKLARRFASNGDGERDMCDATNDVTHLCVTSRSQTLQATVKVSEIV